MSDTALIVIVVVAAVLLAAALLVACLGPASSSLPPAKPGGWFGSYHADWSAAHPGAWVRGEEQSGGFCLGRNGGDVWCSSTLDWDREWFKRNGMELPRQARHVEPKPPGPNEFRIGTLGPGESVSIPIRIDGTDA